MTGCPGRLGKDRGCAAVSFPKCFAGARPDSRPSSLRARLRDRARHLPRPQTGPPPDRRPEPGGVLVPHSGQPHRSGHRLQRGRGPRGGGHGRPLHCLPQRPRPQPARLPTGPPDRRRLRRGPVPLRLRRRAAGGHPDERAHRAHHAARGPYVRRLPEDRIADALRRRHRSPAVAGLEAAGRLPLRPDRLRPRRAARVAVTGGRLVPGLCRRARPPQRGHGPEPHHPRPDRAARAPGPVGAPTAAPASTPPATWFSTSATRAPSTGCTSSR